MDITKLTDNSNVLALLSGEKEKCPYVIEGLKDSTYQAQQICNSGHMLRAASKQVKI